MVTIVISLILVVFLAFVADIFFNEWKKTHALNTDWVPNNDQCAINMLIEDIKGAKERILIYGGQVGNIYSNANILDSLKEKSIPVQIVFEDAIDDSSAIKNLSDKQTNISIFSSGGKKYGNHFRVIDYDYVYVEQEHERKAKERFYKRLPNTRFLPADFVQKFKKIRKLSIQVS